jgi:apolipoprotein N-acyltransferase
MAIEDIVGTVLYAAAELLGIAISKDKVPAKKLGIVGWVILFLFVIFLFWLTITYS